MHLTLERPSSSLLRIPIYPSAIAVTFVLALGLPFAGDAPNVVRPALVALAIGAGLTAVGILLTRSRDEGGALAGIAVIGLAGGDDPRAFVLTFVALVVLALVMWRARSFERRVPWPRITTALNVFAVIFLVLTAGQAAVAAMATKPFAIEPVPIPAPPASPPNVVVLLLDEHGREDILASDYDEDISGFVDGLEERGFHVSSRSRSNYMATQLTLTSMFNMTHLANLDIPTGSETEFGAAIWARLLGNRGFDALRDAGYRIGAVPSGFDKQVLRTADRVLDGGQLTELERTLIVNSALGHVIDWVAPGAMADDYRSRVLWNLDPDNWLPELTGDSDLEAPYFLFVHVPSPHPPFVFDRKGGVVPYAPLVVSEGVAMAPVEPGTADDRGSRYADQLAYIDRKALEAVDKVIAAVPPETVIIIMSDHGPGEHVDWAHLDATTARERFATLFAARTAGEDGLFGDAPTPVNLLPTLLNAYAGAGLPMEPDDSYTGILPFSPLQNVGNPDIVAR
jgi:hypothetical protein